METPEVRLPETPGTRLEEWLTRALDAPLALLSAQVRPDEDPSTARARVID